MKAKYRKRKTHKGSPARMQRYRNTAAERQGGKCCYCGVKMVAPTANSKRAMTAEHLKPKSAGGGASKDNIVAACVSCNSERGAMNWLEFATIKQGA
jgi:5-methylcytosine-specific restriction endonuclease McrA